MNINKKIVYILFIAFFLTLGFILRLKVFLYSRPLWLDECYIFDNISSKGFFSYFAPLLNFQSAPPVFLMLEKISFSLFGIGEKALRLVPFLCSVISLPVFYIFSKNFLKSPFTIVIANALFSINIYCLYYAQELKQYSSDVLCFMVLFLILNSITTENLNKKNTAIYCTVTTTFPLLSIPSYFLVGGWFLREILKYRNEKEKIIKLITLQLPMILVLYFYYTSTLHPQQMDILKISSDLWQQGFLSLNFINNFIIIKSILQYYFLPCSSYITLLILSFLGIILFLKYYKDKEKAFLINSALFIIIASCCHLYPLYNRISLFFLPGIIMLVTKVFDLVSKKQKLISVIILILFIVSFHNYDFNYLKRCYRVDIWWCRFPKIYHNPQKVFKKLIENYQSKLGVIVHITSEPEYKYYKKYYNFYPTNEILLHWICNGSISDYKDKLEKLTIKNKSYCIFYFSDFSKNRAATKAIELFAEQNDIFIKEQGLVCFNIDKK